jgi:transposase-like protein
MRAISFKRHRFPPAVIRLAVYLYFRFTLSIRDVEEMLAQRGIRETVRCWVNKFGPMMAASLRRRKMPPTGRWGAVSLMRTCLRFSRVWRGEGGIHEPDFL